jgi:hypothetical protein
VKSSRHGIVFDCFKPSTLQEMPIAATNRGDTRRFKVGVMGGSGPLLTIDCTGRVKGFT